jgi:catechol 2,3-dioxygenase-like lactoylglutathione lyase family enzyme
VITGIHHFSIACSDADRSLAFYRDLFGLELVSAREVEAGGFVEEVTGVAGARVRIVHLSGYGANLELLEYIEPRGDLRAREPNHAGSAHVCFMADDLEEASALLSSQGVKIRSRDGAPVTVVGGPNDGGKGLYVEDPDGNAIEIIELARPWPTAEGR